MVGTNVGKFIVFEGIDGSGTTTQAAALSSYLFQKDKANAPVLTREPTSLNVYGTEIRRRLEGRLLSDEKEIHDFVHWANLFVNDRKWHLKNVVNYATHLGLPVISDRHMLSTLAYQSTQGGEMKQLLEMHTGMRAPDLTLYLHVPAGIAVQRIMQNRAGDPEYFEKKEGFLSRTAENYNRAITLAGKQQNVVMIDGSQSLEQVTKEVQYEVDKLFGYND